jgi:hypothetical protein
VVGDVEEILHGLGDGITCAWRDRNYDERIFPLLATEALADAGLHRLLDLPDLARWLVSAPRLPAQQYRPFGQPPITLYRGHKFYIEALVWLESTTAVHQHGFAGAFAVLQGSSLHSRFDFEARDYICAQLLIGTVQWCSSELLAPGDVRTIEPGPGFIHSLFHLAHPSVSIVVRTDSAPGYSPQYSYLPPGLAVDPFYQPEPFLTQLRVLEALHTSDSNAFQRTAELMLETADLWTTLKVLSLAYADRMEPATWEPLVALSKRRHGTRTDPLLAALTEEARQVNITARRDAIRRADHRFFLALLLNVPDREQILRLVARQYPDVDPADQVVAWVRELSADGTLGLRFNPLSISLLKMAMRDASFADVCATLGQAVPAAELRTRSQELREVWDELHSAVILAPLVRAGSVGAGMPAGDGVSAREGGSGVLGRNVKYYCEVPSLDGTPAGALRPDVRATIRTAAPSLNDDLAEQGWRASALLNGSRIVWVDDLVRGLSFPYWLSEEQERSLDGAGEGLARALAAAGLPIGRDDEVAARRQQWVERIDTAQTSIAERGYGVIGELLPATVVAALARYYAGLRAAGRLSPEPASGRSVAHNEPLSVWLHRLILPVLAAAIPEKVKPSYSFVTSYGAGAQLERHTDRPQCEYTVSLALEAPPEVTRQTAWPLLLESRGDQAVVESRALPGDAVIFRGRELVHSRPPLDGAGSYTNLLLHFVPLDYMGSLD